MANDVAALTLHGLALHAACPPADAACDGRRALGYSAIWADPIDACFRAAEAHGTRATIGKGMMDRVTYGDRLPRDDVLETSLRQSDCSSRRPSSRASRS